MRAARQKSCAATCTRIRVALKTRVPPDKAPSQPVRRSQKRGAPAPSVWQSHPDRPWARQRAARAAAPPYSHVAVSDKLWPAQVPQRRNKPLGMRDPVKTHVSRGPVKIAPPLCSLHHKNAVEVPTGVVLVSRVPSVKGKTAQVPKPFNTSRRPVLGNAIGRSCRCPLCLDQCHRNTKQGPKRQKARQY